MVVRLGFSYPRVDSFCRFVVTELDSCEERGRSLLRWCLRVYQASEYVFEQQLLARWGCIARGGVARPENCALAASSRLGFHPTGMDADAAPCQESRSTPWLFVSFATPMSPDIGTHERFAAQHHHARIGLVVAKGERGVEGTVASTP